MLQISFSVRCSPVLTDFKAGLSSIAVYSVNVNDPTEEVWG